MVRTSAFIVGWAFITALSNVYADEDRVSRGRFIAHDVYKGNCLACHRVPGDAEAVTLANIGPPLIAMRARFPDRAELRMQIWDATARNSLTVMPPFGKHGVLTEQEIDLVIEYLYQY